MSKTANLLEENLMFLERIGKRKSYSKIFPDAPMLAEKNRDMMLKIEKRILEILADETFTDKTATIYDNAPLALMQIQMETELHTLQKIVGIQPSNVRKLRGETK